MSGDISTHQLRFIAADGINIGRMYFERDHDLHASDVGGFCPHLPATKHMFNVIHDGELKQLAVSAPVAKELFLIMEMVAAEEEREQLIQSQRSAARRFKQSKLKFHARNPST